MKKNKIVLLLMTLTVSLSFSMMQSFAEDVSNNGVEGNDKCIEESLIGIEESKNESEETDNSDEESKKESEETDNSNEESINESEDINNNTEKSTEEKNENNATSDSGKLHICELVQPEEGAEPVLVDENGNRVYENLVPDDDDVECLGGGLDPSNYSYYNLAEKKLVCYDCENQSQTGTCWAYAAVGSAFSNLLFNKKIGNRADLSEEQIVWFGLCKASANTSDPLYGDAKYNGIEGYSAGGSVWDTTVTMSRGTGLIKAGKLPDFSNWDSKQKFQDLSGYESLRYESEYILTNTDIFDPTSSEGRKDIKWSILNRGALKVSYYTDKSLYKLDSSSGNLSYYNPVDKNYANHAVMIVGYDDNYNKNNFLKKPNQNGAWICRNSWGSDWGKNGYFYISYYDPNLSYASSYIMTERSNYGKRIYQYAGDNKYSCYYENSGFAEANIFTATDNDVVTTIGFDTTSASIPYEIQIYKNLTENNPQSGELVSSEKGTIQYAGFHTVPLTEQVSVKKGEKFSVVVIQKKKDAGINLDSHKYSSTSSYISSYDLSDGMLTGWSGTESSDVNIKAYTKDKFDVTAAVSFSLPSGDYEEGQTLSLSCATPGASIYYTLDGSVPSKTNGILYTGAISLDTEFAIDTSYSVKAVAVKNGNLDSDILSNHYIIQGKTAVAFSICEMEPEYVYVDDDTTFEDIFKQLNLCASVIVRENDTNMPIQVPVNWDLEKPYDGTFDNTAGEQEHIILSGTLSYGVQQEKIDYSNTGNVVYLEVILKRRETLNLRAFSDDLEEGLRITLSNDITDIKGYEKVEIYYTTDGSEPTKENGFLYDGPIFLMRQEFDTGFIIRARAYSKGIESPEEFNEFYPVSSDSQKQVGITIKSYNPIMEEDYLFVSTIAGITFGEAIDNFAELTDGYEYTGRNFKGWNILLDDGSLGESIYCSSIVPRKDITIVGNWSGICHNIIFNCDGGIIDGEYPTGIEEGQPIESLPTVSKDGFIFLGWFYQDKEIKVGDVLDITTDIEVIAKWERDPSKTIGYQLYKGQKCDITDVVNSFLTQNNCSGAKIKFKKSKNIAIKKQKGRYILTAKKAGEGFAVLSAKNTSAREEVKIFVYAPAKKTQKIQNGKELSVYDLFNIPSFKDNAVVVFSKNNNIVSINENGNIKAVNPGKTTVTIQVQSLRWKYSKKYKVKVKVL